MATFTSIGGNTGPTDLSNGGEVLEHTHTLSRSWVFVTPFYADDAQRERTIAIARSYRGVKESPAGSNHQQFGVWYGMDRVPWCAEFASFCLYTAGLRFTDATTAKGFSYCPSIVAWGKRHGRISRTPHLADLAVAVDGSRPHHVEIVTAGPGFRAAAVAPKSSTKNTSPVTRNLALTSPLTTGNDVGWVENRLRQLGFLPAGRRALKRYDVTVHNAVVAFQEAHDLNVDGVCGPVTAHHLQIGK